MQMPEAQGQIIQPRKPDIVQELIERFGQETMDTITSWAAEKLGKMKVEVEGMLKSKTLAIGEEPIGNRKLRVILYQKVDEITLSADVEIKIEK